jgi:NADPH2:quinone reductase
MKAMVIDHFGTEEELHLNDLPTPQPTENEVQIQLYYTSVNPVDWKIREGMLQNLLPHEFPLIPGWDAAGVVTALGSRVKKFKVGDKVFAYCRKPTVQWGTYAEYICFEADHVAKIPNNINFAQAAAIPLVGLTAWQALFDFAKLNKGESILINAGAGGVGSFAIQLAKNIGARIVTTASPQNHDYVKELGANFVIDYHQSNYAHEIKNLIPEGIDVILDCVGGKTLEDSLNLIKTNGRLVSIVRHLDTSKLPPAKKIQFSFVFVSPNGNELAKIASLIEEGKIHTPHLQELPLEEAAKAQEMIREGHTRGKIVLKIK